MKTEETLLNIVSRQLEILGLGYSANHLREIAINTLITTYPNRPIDLIVRELAQQPLLMLEALSNALEINITLHHNGSINPLFSENFEININIGVDNDNFFSVETSQTIISAVHNGNINTLLFLLNSGENVNIRDANGNTALHIAVANNNYDMVDILLTFGANPNLINNNGETALHMAINSGNAEIIANIVTYQYLHIDARDDDGNTALHIAAARGFFPAAMILINSGANIHLENNNGQNPLEIADRLRNIEIANLILEADYKESFPNDLNFPEEGHYASNLMGGLNNASPLNMMNNIYDMFASGR